MKTKKIWYWVPVFVFLIIAIFFRWTNNFRTELIPGINGGYYPFQVKIILEHFRMGFSDMPFVFYLEAFIAKIITLFSNNSLNTNILLASKITDAIVPPLITIPVFLFAFFRFVKIKSNQQLLLSGVFLLLTLFTHIGCFGALISFAGVYALLYVVTHRRSIKQHKHQIITALGAILVCILLLIIFDYKRLERLVTFLLSPLTFFENPVLLFLLDNQAIMHGLWLINFFVCNLLAILGFVYVLIRRKRIENKEERLYALSIAITTLFLTSPLLGIEWGERFLWIGVVFLIVEYIFIFAIISRKAFRIVLAVFFILLIVYSIRPAMLGKRPAISEISYKELFEIKQKVPIDKQDIILTRHGLEWYTGFVIDVNVGQDYSLTKDEFDNYQTVYILKQINGNNTKRVAWSHFLEPEIPKTANQLFKGSHFELYQLTEPLPYTKAISSPPLTYGRITGMNKNNLIVKNERYRYTVELKENTDIRLKRKDNQLKKGMTIEVWGKRIPFSLSIRAKTIHQVTPKKK